MSWQLQYQSKDHARFYADKRDSTLLRRISNSFELRMIRRALRRVRRKAAFRTALDCASGTGRMLPVLAEFDVSVIAMDTAAEMLEEGRRYHHLFREEPEIKVGSALEIPLPDKCVDVVLCSRLLHHFPDAESRVQILREFARVAKVGVVVSFFDAITYRGWRRNRKKRPHRDQGRYAISRRQFRQEAELAGLTSLGMNALLRFHAEVTAAAFLVSGAEAGRDRELDWLRELGLSSADGLMNFRPAGVAALSNSSDTFRVDCDDSVTTDAPRQIFVKRYRYRGWGPRLRGFFRGTFFGKSRARLEFDLLNEMRRRGVPSVVPITFVEDRRGGFLRSAALITQGQPNAEPLPDYFSNQYGGWDASQRQAFSEALAKAIAGLHAAGVQHGGLFWRNILVTEIKDGWSFTLLDPNRRGRLFSGPVPSRARVADLSDFAASGAALQWSDDFDDFMARYCELSASDVDKDSLIIAVRSQAKRKSGQEDHRMAVGSALAWLQRRVENAGAEARPSAFDSVDGFFESLRKADLRGAVLKRKAIHFDIRAVEPSGQMRSYDVALEPEGIVVKEGSAARADLVVQADADAWLSIINARPEALDAIRAGRLSFQGDTQPLATLVKWLDGATAAASPRAVAVDHGDTTGRGVPPAQPGS